VPGRTPGAALRFIFLRNAARVVRAALFVKGDATR
jgi:hypothetical protein